MTKKIILKKQDTKAKDSTEKRKYSNGRVCLNCGINIDHRSPKVQFCCPSCKAIYKERMKYEAMDKPKLKTKTTKEFHEDAASVYYPHESQSRLKEQSKQIIVVSTPKDIETPLTPIQKFYQRYGK